MAALTAPAGVRPFQSSPLARLGWLVLLVYLAWAMSSLEFSWPRFVLGLDNGAKFIARMFPPNFERWDLLVKGLSESLQMAFIASFLGFMVGLTLSLERTNLAATATKAPPLPVVAPSAQVVPLPGTPR